jgi:four helix bundle protein
MIFRFRKFPVYIEVRAMRKELKAFCLRKFPKHERFSLLDQLFRALNSILLNIAEGSHKYSDIEFSKYLNIALTSLSEVVACLDIAYDDGYISQDELKHWTAKCEALHRQLSAFSAKVRTDSKRR